MENASKALIIAGAILLSIAIIGIGMAVFNNAQESIHKSNMSSTEITQFNSKFDSYEGSIRGSNLKSLISTIISNNAAEDGTTARFVSITGTLGNVSVSEGALNDTAMAAARSNIRSSQTYTVTLNYTDGLITSIDIQ